MGYSRPVGSDARFSNRLVANANPVQLCTDYNGFPRPLIVKLK